MEVIRKLSAWSIKPKKPKAAQRFMFGRTISAESWDIALHCGWGFGCFWLGDFIGQIHTQRKYLYIKMAKSELDEVTPYSYDARVNAGLRASLFHPFVAGFFAAFIYAPLRYKFFGRMNKVWPLPIEREKQGYAIGLRCIAEHLTLTPVVIFAYFTAMGAFFDHTLSPTRIYNRNKRKIVPSLLGTWSLAVIMQSLLYFVAPRFLWGFGVHMTTIFWAGYLSKVDFSPP